MKGQRIVASFIDAMKLMKQTPLSRAELAEEAEVTLDTAARWVKDLEAHGFIAEIGKKRAKTGRPTTQYAVTKQWGGQA